MMYGWGYRGYDVWGFISTLVMMAVIFVVGVYVVRYLVSSSSSHEQHRAHHAPEEDALSILKKRYAKGEIDKKEYEEKKKDLSE